MFCLRKINSLPIITLSALLLANLPQSFAAPGQMQTKITSLSSTGTTNVDFSGPIQNADSFATTFSTRSPGLWKNRIVLNGSYTRLKNDYRNSLLIDRRGAESRLSDRFNKSEQNFDLGMEASQSGHTLNLGYGESIGDSPFAYRSDSAAYNYAFFNGATVIGASYNSTRQAQPQTYFIDPQTFRTQQRPLSLTSQRIELMLEQTINEDWKVGAFAFQGKRFEDRPSHHGAELRNTYALHERIFLRSDFGFLRERRNKGLRDEKGFFSAYWLEAQITWEPVYDLLLTAAIGTTVEREYRPWIARTNQVGTDSFGLRASYRHQRFNFGMGGNLARSNTSYRTRAITGDITWEL